MRRRCSDRANRARKPEMLAQALNRRAFVEIRTGNSRDAVTTASDARTAAQRGRRSDLEAMAC